jgi:hypothetical protein
MIFATVDQKENRIKNYHNSQDYYNKTGYVLITLNILETN